MFHFKLTISTIGAWLCLKSQHCTYTHVCHDLDRKNITQNQSFQCYAEICYTLEEYNFQYESIYPRLGIYQMSFVRQALIRINQLVSNHLISMQRMQKTYHTVSLEWVPRLWHRATNKSIAVVGSIIHSGIIRQQSFIVAWPSS